MSYPYFFIDADSVDSGKIKITGEDLSHLVNALRSKIGDAVYVSDNERYKYETEIADINKDEVTLHIKNRSEIARKTPVISLFQCVLKKNSMELVIQKSTEIGVDELIPVISERVIVDKKKIIGKIKRWQKISDRASKQCGRDFKCRILPPRSIYDIQVSSYDLFYIPYEKGTSGNDLAGKENVSSIGYIIGPEGGFEPEEFEFFENKKAKVIKFGENIYRSETAAIYFLSVLDYLIRNRELKR